MIKPRRVRFGALLFACWCANAIAAENAELILTFGGDPGSPLPHAYSYGLPETAEPTYTLRIPVVNPDIRSVFYDTVLTVSNPEKIVQRVNASRAYRSLAECEKAREIIAGKLATALPRETVGDDRWQRRSADGRVLARATCENLRHEPVPVLNFELLLQQ
jgi:hypothetical protein